MGKNKVIGLKKVSMSIEFGDLTVIAGPSGSGKTTLLNVCGLIDTFDEGEMYFEETKISGLSNSEINILRRDKIGFIFQQFNLIPVLSVYENAEYPLHLLSINKKKRKEVVDYYLDKVGLYHRKTHKSSELSGGEKQRVSIARALVKNPSLIIADEPTANLDSSTTDEIIKLLVDLNEKNENNGKNGKITCIIASHDPLVINAGKRVLNMRDGKLQEAAEGKYVYA